MNGVYLDIHGRLWATTKLDSLLAEPGVLWSVKLAFMQGADLRGGWSPSAVLAWARRQYRREEPTRSTPDDASERIIPL